MPDRLLPYEVHENHYGIENFEEQAGVRLDEFVVDTPRLIHFEHMDDDAAYLGIYGADGHNMQFRFAVENGQLRVWLDWCNEVDNDGD